MAKIPEGLKCEVTIEEAYSPFTPPEVPEGWEFVRFSWPTPAESYLAAKGDVILCLERLSTSAPRIIVRKKPVRRKVRFGDLKLGVLFHFAGERYSKCNNVDFPYNNATYENGKLTFHLETLVEVEGGPEVELPKPKRMMHDRARNGQHVWIPSCVDAGCVPVEPAKPRRWVVEFSGDPTISVGASYICPLSLPTMHVISEEVKQISTHDLVVMCLHMPREGMLPYVKAFLRDHTIEVED